MKSKMIFIILICIFLVVLIAFAITIIGNSNKKTAKEWFVEVNNENTLSIKVGYDEPFTFGASKLYIYVNNILLFETEIKNDGVNLNSKNYKVEWIENGAFLSFFGSEQYEEQYLIELRGDSIIYSITKDKYSNIK